MRLTPILGCVLILCGPVAAEEPSIPGGSGLVPDEGIGEALQAQLRAR